MSYLVNIQIPFEVKRPIEECFAYVSDFSTTEQWDHTILSSHKISDGSICKNTQFKLLMRFGLRKVPLDYRITEYQYPKKVVLEGTHPDFKATDTIEFEELGDSCRINWNLDIEFQGSFSKLVPIFENSIKRGAKKSIEGLKSALNDDLPAPVPLKRNQVADFLIWPGMWKFTKQGYKQARKRWNPMSASVKDKHIVITGATSGLGLASASSLAHLGAHVTLVGRNLEKTKGVQQAIIKKTGNQNIHIEIADMSLIEDVKKLAQNFIKKNRSIDVLINNAGALFNPRQETQEGAEKSFALLLFSPYVLTTLLFPLLKSATNSRVINVSSGGMYTQKIAVDDMQSLCENYSGSVAYARAKRGLVITSEQWAEEWKKDNIHVHCMHPGWADTPAVESSLPEFHRIMSKFLRTPEEGADTITWLAIAKEANKTSGLFWLDREIHTTHMLRKTKESPQERSDLRDYLINYAKQFNLDLS